MFFLFLFYSDLYPGSIDNREITFNIGSTKNITYNLRNLSIGNRYEVKVSRPSTSPANVNFFIHNLSTNPIISDEKVMFTAESDSLLLDIIMKANGVPINSIQQYTIPINTSLERLIMGITIHVWKLIIYTLPILFLFVHISIKMF